ncbi:MAG: PAS domain S-box-containing protein [Oceanicoccus sp.]|jgi:PAS domain S-box-containing protein
MESLRIRAERRLTTAGKQEISAMSAIQIAELVHELETHQIELELQNEELVRAQLELSELRDQYADLYDSAPIGYVTTNHTGIITQVNLTFAEMLDVPRPLILNQSLSAFIVDQDIYYKYKKVIFDTKERCRCKLRLRKQDNSYFWVSVDSIRLESPDQGQYLILSILNDISARQETEAGLEKTRK